MEKLRIGGGVGVAVVQLAAAAVRLMGDPVEQPGSMKDVAYIYNHVNIKVLYHLSDQYSGLRVVGFEVGAGEPTTRELGAGHELVGAGDLRDGAAVARGERRDLEIRGHRAHRREKRLPGRLLRGSHAGIDALQLRDAAGRDGARVRVHDVGGGRPGVFTRCRDAHRSAGRGSE